jgi:uncharacterized membrane protein
VTPQRLVALWARLRLALWPLPALFVVCALALGTVLSEWQPADGTAFEGWVYRGTADSARDVLSVLAGAMITVTGLTFSLTVIALQMASSQFSPRVLRGFLGDRGNQLVLSALLSTFAYCIAVIRGIQDEGAPGGEDVPRLAVTVGIVLTLAAVGALVYFIHHLTQQLRADVITQQVTDDTLRAIDRVFDELGGDSVPDVSPPPPEGEVRSVTARRSGYLQSLDVAELAEGAGRIGATVRLRPPVGAHVSKGTTLAWVWSHAGFDADDDELGRLLHDHLHLGPERTLEQDPAFGIRQVVDIAVKALSTGLNDPTTAVDAIGQLSALTCRLTAMRLGTLVESDDRRRPRVVVPRPGYAEYLDLVCDQPRRYGGDDQDVVLAVLRLLNDAAEVATTDEHRSVLAHQCARTVELAGRDLDETDMVRVEAAAGLVRRSLEQGSRPYPEAELA